MAMHSNLLLKPRRGGSALRLLLLPANEQGDGERWESSDMGERGMEDETRDGEGDD